MTGWKVVLPFFYGVSSFVVELLLSLLSHPAYFILTLDSLRAQLALSSRGPQTALITLVVSHARLIDPHFFLCCGRPSEVVPSLLFQSAPKVVLLRFFRSKVGMLCFVFHYLASLSSIIAFVVDTELCRSTTRANASCEGRQSLPLFPTGRAQLGPCRTLFLETHRVFFINDNVSSNMSKARFVSTNVDLRVHPRPPDHQVDLVGPEAHRPRPESVAQHVQPPPGTATVALCRKSLSIHGVETSRVYCFHHSKKARLRLRRRQEAEHTQAYHGGRITRDGMGSRSLTKCPT